MINVISSFASLLGPVLGGILYGAYGLLAVLEISIASFAASAVMEIFIRIPYRKQESAGSIIGTALGDLRESVHFICRQKPVIGKGLLIACGINLFMSAMIIVGLPYLITEVLPFTAGQANRLYGYAQGALAAGGVVGGISAGALADRLQIGKAGNAMYGFLFELCAEREAVVVLFAGIISLVIAVRAGKVFGRL